MEVYAWLHWVPTTQRPYPRSRVAILFRPEDEQGVSSVMPHQLGRTLVHGDVTVRIRGPIRVLDAAPQGVVRLMPTSDTMIKV